MIDGRSIIGGRPAAGGGRLFRAVNPASGEHLDPEFVAATPADVDRACRQAEEAFEVFAHSSGKERGGVLRAIAERMEGHQGQIVERGTLETALPPARLQSEMGRTCSQLRLMAAAAEEGSWVDARIDHAAPPRPDVRSMLRPLGPVAVFGASNFPLAFSVAGGDTASALAAGCPVVVKAHPAHPGTSALVGQAVSAAVVDCGLPGGLFSLLFDEGYETGINLVRHPAIKAVGFTGSRRGGMALVEAASQRREAIPVYAEMGSVNPVFVLPGALAERSSEIAERLHASATLGVGQFCTNPGLIFLVGSAKELTALLAPRFESTPRGVMLTAAICDAYRRGVEGVRAIEGVEHSQAIAAQGSFAQAALFSTTAEIFLSHPELGQEIFGPSTLVVECGSEEELLRIARSMEGQLTASIHAAEIDNKLTNRLLPLLERKAGRIVMNGFPTGVDVGHAMVHGGPFPATSDGRSSSVGTRAIARFARPVCFQDCPDHLRPPELQEANPLRIVRMVDGTPGKA